MRRTFLVHQRQQTLSVKSAWIHHRKLIDLVDGPKRSLYERESTDSGQIVRESQRQMDRTLIGCTITAKYNAHREHTLSFALANESVMYREPVDALLLALIN